jgi:hypothetical protein
MVKRSVRDEPIQIVIHMCMEAILGILLKLSLSQTSKNAVFLIITYVFSSAKLEKRAKQFCLEVRELRGRWTGWEAEGRVGPNNVYTYE